MGRRIALIQGHPGSNGTHLCDSLADAYARAAHEAGHEVRVITVAQLDFELLRDARDWQKGDPSPAIRQAQQTLAWAEHLVFVFPLWLGDMPALLKGFLEQALRPGFAIGKAEPGKMWRKLLKGRSARVIVTMGMPAFFYRLYYRAHSVKSFKRNILDFVGISPVRVTLVGGVETEAPGARELSIAKMYTLGRAAR
jgi:putative NADPH-quinone reductase